MSRRSIVTLAIASVAIFMVTLDNLVVTTALPSIRRDLGASLEDLEWTVNGYTLAFAVRAVRGDGRRDGWTDGRVARRRASRPSAHAPMRASVVVMNLSASLVVEVAGGFVYAGHFYPLLLRPCGCWHRWGLIGPGSFGGRRLRSPDRCGA